MAESEKPSGETAERAKRRGRKRPSRARGVVAVTGIHGTIASSLIRRLEEDESCARLVLIDVRAPSMPVRRSVFHSVDLTEPLADVVLAEILRREQVETVVHLALRSAPKPWAHGAHELETVGTMYLLNAVADNLAHTGSVEKIVTCTTAMVYGARPENPNYLVEDHPLHGDRQAAFVRDKVDIERQLADFRRATGLPVCILRPCWTLGTPDSIAARLLRDWPAITVLGFDPLLQLLHADDLVAVLERAVDRTYDGAFNVAAPGVLPLSALFDFFGRRPLALPAPLAKGATDFLWRMRGIGTGVPIDFLRYLWVVDGKRAEEELEFVPRYDSRAVAAYFAERE